MRKPPRRKATSPTDDLVAHLAQKVEAEQWARNERELRLLRNIRLALQHMRSAELDSVETHVAAALGRAMMNCEIGRK